MFGVPNGMILCIYCRKIWSAPSLLNIEKKAVCLMEISEKSYI